MRCCSPVRGSEIDESQGETDKSAWALSFSRMGEERLPSRRMMSVVMWRSVGHAAGSSESHATNEVDVEDDDRM
jgi:hypothetical protein